MNDVKAKYCFYCEREFGKQDGYGTFLLRTKDHIIPISKGGRRAFSSNILYCCHKCNKLKGDMMAEEFVNHLLAKIAAVKNDTYNKRLHTIILKNVRQLLLDIAPVRHKMIRPAKKAFDAFRIVEIKKETRPSTPLWWRGLNEK